MEHGGGCRTDFSSQSRALMLQYLMRLFVAKDQATLIGLSGPADCPLGHARDAMLILALILAAIACPLLLTYPRMLHATKIDLPLLDLPHGIWTDRPVDRVRISADGRITLNGIPCADPADLGRRVAARQMLNPVPGVLVEPDANARYDDFLKTLAAIKKTHVWRLCIDMKAGERGSTRLRAAECDMPGPVL